MAPGPGVAHQKPPPPCLSVLDAETFRVAGSSGDYSGPGSRAKPPALYLTDYLTSSQALRVNQIASANVLLSGYSSWLLIGSHSAQPHQ